MKWYKNLNERQKIAREIDRSRTRDGDLQSALYACLQRTQTDSYRFCTRLWGGGKGGNIGKNGKKLKINGSEQKNMLKLKTEIARNGNIKVKTMGKRCNRVWTINKKNNSFCVSPSIYLLHFHFRLFQLFLAFLVTSSYFRFPIFRPLPVYLRFTTFFRNFLLILYFPLFTTFLFVCLPRSQSLTIAQGIHIALTIQG